MKTEHLLYIVLGSLLLLTLMYYDMTELVEVVEEESISKYQQAMQSCMSDVPTSHGYDYCLTVWEQYIPH